VADPDFQARLVRLLEHGNLTVADLARWFGRSHPTVRGWVLRGHRPMGAPGDVKEVMDRTTQLEYLLKRKRGLPVPRMSNRDRGAYIETIRRST